MKQIIPLILVVIFATNVFGDFYHYTFTGQLPPGSTNHTHVGDGESFTASFFVDSSVLDPIDSSVLGLYLDSVVVGQVTFSGGFESTIDFSGADILVSNDNSSTDSIILETLEGPVGGLNRIVAATTDLNALATDALPPPGTSFATQPAPRDSFTQLIYFDQFGTIEYSTLDETNLVFKATTIPEPSSYLLFMNVVVCIALLNRNRKPQLDGACENHS